MAKVRRFWWLRYSLISCILRQLHAYLTVNTLIHGLADASLLQAQPVFGLDTLQSTHPGALLDYFYNYLAGGLGS